MSIETQIELSKPSVSIFSTLETFEHWQRVAKMLATSSIVPKAYSNNISNTMVAIELANRIGISPFMVMQNLDVIQGKPSWNSTFIIAALNSCGRFSPIRFVFEGTPGTDEYGCRAMSKDNEGLILKGPLVDWKMVKAVPSFLKLLLDLKSDESNLKVDQMANGAEQRYIKNKQTMACWVTGQKYITLYGG